MGNFFAEIKRRHIYRVAAAYAVVAWVLLQIVNNLAPGLNLPNWAITLVIVLLAIGFPIALLFCWIQHLAPADGAAPRGATTKLDYALIGALVLVIALVSYDQLVPPRNPGPSGTPAGSLSVAVLPFANLSGDEKQKFFSDGMTEEISSALAKLEGLTVLARSSSFAPEIQDLTAREKGRVLNARYLIEGSVRQAGNRVRISAQLVGGADGVQIWSENYDRELTDIFAIQEDIAQAIAGALRIPLGLQQGQSLVRNGTENLDTYEQYLKARALRRETKMPEAISILESVVARDPGFARAWSLLANVYRLTPGYISASVEEYNRIFQSYTDKAEKAAREAIRSDPREALAYAVLAQIDVQRRNWVSADSHYQQALALDRNEPDVLHSYSLRLAEAGRIKEALGLRERLRTLEPFVPLYNIATASQLHLAGQNQAAMALLESVAPTYSTVGYNRNLLLAQLHAAEGRFDQAADELLASSTERAPRQMVEDAARLIRAAPANAGENLPQLERGLEFVYAYIGAPERVIALDEAFVAGGLGFFDSSLWSAELASVRKTERFKALVRNAGLVEYWRAKGWPDLCKPTAGDDFLCT